MTRFLLIPACSLLMGCAGLFPTPLPAADDAARSVVAVSKPDADFMRMALMVGMAGIASSELALKRQLSGPEQAFAQQVVDDQTKMDEDLRAIARAKGVALPDALEGNARMKVDNLAKKNDLTFAADYLDLQIETHQNALNAFKDVAKDAKDAEIKAFAFNQLLHLKAHLDQANLLAKKH